MSAAFDTVNHQLLLSILKTKGISGAALQWFKSYLSGRLFRVLWRGEVSKTQHLATGVPQGSVLGPFLFSIYITRICDSETLNGNRVQLLWEGGGYRQMIYNF